MNTIVKLIELGLIGCYKVGVIDWLPNSNQPETFNAECEIKLNKLGQALEGRGGHYMVVINGVFTVVDASNMEAWYYTRLDAKDCTL